MLDEEFCHRWVRREKLAHPGFERARAREIVPLAVYDKYVLQWLGRNRCRRLRPLREPADR
jgi:hypothetical protein